MDGLTEHLTLGHQEDPLVYLHWEHESLFEPIKFIEEEVNTKKRESTS